MHPFAPGFAAYPYAFHVFVYLSLYVLLNQMFLLFGTLTFMSIQRYQQNGTTWVYNWESKIIHWMR